MHFIKSNPFALLVSIVALLALAAAACGGSDPEELEIPVSVADGKMSPVTIQVKQGDMVTLKINADEAGEFHLHTYDIESDIPAGEETDFFFVANATGRFRITYHPQADTEGHGVVFESEELKPGDSFNYTVAEHLAGETVPFHSQLRPALTGTIFVDEGGSGAGEVNIEFTDAAVVPAELHVVPGTAITWVNNSSVDQLVVSGLHANMEMEGGNEGEGGGHDDEGHDDEGEEVELGFLEVQPR